MTIMNRKREQRRRKRHGKDKSCPQEDQHQDHKEQQQAPISVLLSVNKNQCAAGGRLQGKISIFVPQSAQGLDNVSGIELALQGYELLDVRRVLSPTKVLVERYRATVVHLKEEAVPFTSPLVAGQYEFPFCWKLPEGEELPVTMRCSSAGASSCQIQYTLTASLSTKTSDPLKCAVINTRQPVAIISSGRCVNSDINNNTVVAEPKKSSVRSWIRKRGSIELGLDTDTSVVSPDSKVDLTITGRGNLSSVPVKELLIQWVETVCWGDTYEGERLSRRILAETTVCVDNLPQWQPQGKGTVVADEQSTADQKITTKLYLCSNANDSYAGHLINVKHSIRVTAITKGDHISNPKFKIPIEVCKHNQTKSKSCIPIIMAKAQLSSFHDYADKDSDDPRDCHGEKGIQPDIEIPEAVPITMDDYLVCPTVIHKEEEQQHPCCCSSESTVVHSESASAPSCCSVHQNPSTMPHQTVLKPALVMTVIE